MRFVYSMLSHAAYSPVGVTRRRVAPYRLAMLDRAALGAHPCYFLTRLAISALQALQLGSLGWEARFGWSSDALDGLHALSWARLRAEGDAFVVLFLIASGAAARAAGGERRARVEGRAADGACVRARAAGVLVLFALVTVLGMTTGIDLCPGEFLDEFFWFWCALALAAALAVASALRLLALASVAHAPPQDWRRHPLWRAARAVRLVPAGHAELRGRPRGARAGRRVLGGRAHLLRGHGGRGAADSAAGVGRQGRPAESLGARGAQPGAHGKRDASRSLLRLALPRSLSRPQRSNCNYWDSRYQAVRVSMNLCSVFLSRADGAAAAAVMLTLALVPLLYFLRYSPHIVLRFNLLHGEPPLARAGRPRVWRLTRPRSRHARHRGVVQLCDARRGGARRCERL